MKLIFCRFCRDVVTLVRRERRSCLCKKSYGQYKDTVNAVYGGDAVPIGFSNDSLIKAVKNPGSNFDAFSIKYDSETFKREADRS